MKMAAEPSQQVYQFKITLKESKPPIWRRVLVPDNFKLINLHNAIQSVMDWGCCHLWQFGDYRSKLNKKLKITDVFTEINKQVLYIYDFGDNWDHIVKLEAIKPADPAATYPICLAGRQAAPPCCCGGIDGFYEMLEIIKNPSHPEYEEKWEWLRSVSADDCFQPGYKFDPKSVDFDTDFFRDLVGGFDSDDDDTDDNDTDDDDMDADGTDDDDSDEDE